MDDDRTRETLDTLAELFLTGTKAGRSQAAQSADKHNGDGRGDGAALDGPAPYRLPPKPTLGARPPQPTRTAQRVSEGQGLRLTGGEGEQMAVQTPETPRPRAEEAGRRLATPAAWVETVALGNLPGMSGPWLTQYAQLLADKDGAVAIVHVDEQELEVELVEPSGRWQKRAATEANDAVTLMRELVSDAQAPVRTVLVHAQTGEDETDEVPGPRSVGGCWTLLCGSDDAAVHSAGELIRRQAEQTPGAAGPQVGVMLMGSDAETSEAAAARIREAASQVLARPVEYLGHHQRMGPVNVRTVGRFAAKAGDWVRLRTFLATLAEPEQAAGQSEQPPAAEAPKRADAANDLADMHAAREEAAGRRARPGEGSGQGAATEQVVENAREAVSEQTAAATDQTQGAHETTTTVQEPLDLTAFLARGPGAVKGGVALEARCPTQPEMQLVLDQDGTLHLLRQHEAGETADATAGLRAAIVDLLAARAWVAEHLEVLALTQRQCRFNREAEPALHLFTDRADVATGLASRLGGMLKLHLLQRVTLGKESGWVSTVLG